MLVAISRKNLSGFCHKVGFNAVFHAHALGNVLKQSSSVGYLSDGETKTQKKRVA